MNIVHIEDYFHPDAGYQVNILSKYMVKQGQNVTVITSEMDKIPDNLTAFFGRNNIEKRDSEYTKKTGVNIIRLPLKGYISSRGIFTSKIFKLVDDLEPDILFVHGNDTLTAMRYLTKIKKLKYPVVMDSHMLEIASLNRFNKIFRAFYRKIFTPIIIKNKIPIIRTQNDQYVQKCLGIPLLQCPWISIGSDTLLFHPDKTVKSKFRKIYNINDDDFVVIYAGKLDEFKGGLLLAKTFEKRFNTDKNIVVVVLGNTNGEYGQIVDKVFAKSDNRIIRFPTQKYVDLPKFYQAADLSVFPRQCSLSFYDVQACGLPVICEENNINVQRLQYNNGFTFNSNNIEDFRDKVLKCICMIDEEYKKIGEKAHSFVNYNFNYEDIANEYMKLIESEVNKFKKKMISEGKINEHSNSPFVV